MRHILWLCGVLILAGCSTLRGAPPSIIDTDAEVDNLSAFYGTDQVVAYLETTEPVARRQLRNRIVATRMLAIDIYYSDYVQQLSTSLRGGNLGADIASIALTTAATLIEPVLTKNILTAIDTGLKGSKQAFDKDVLLERTLPIIIQEMEAARVEIATQIWTSLGAKDDSEYPLQLALSQVDSYFRSGTLNGGLEKATRSAAENLAKSKDEFAQNALKVSYGENEYTKIINLYLGLAESNPELFRQRVAFIDKIIQDFGKVGDDQNFISPVAVSSTSDAKYLPLQRKIAEEIEKTISGGS